MSKHTPPTLGADSFNCPHCGALAHQQWLKLWAEPFERTVRPRIADEKTSDTVRHSLEFSEERKQQLLEWLEQSRSKRPFLEKHDSSTFPRDEFHNLWASRCFSCREITVWVGDRITYPDVKLSVAPSEDLPSDVRADFEEAAIIVEHSPRGAAALLRLAIQRLLKHLGEKGDNINEDIASLVKKGLNQRIQQALDIVRVIGNNAVHPGQVDLRDDRETAVKLFGLVNLIVDQMITQPNQIDSMFNGLPEGARKSIERRDQ
ncbi:DUF4145 domain-containing protein [Microvirga mediterraneensis]|uniref:DUF4145 domain-containing protein n=1 Tax=Microvirga mediterraneensis TaxID=2754695 RepID=A0A838BIE1_9HYPH|nr:DUF4145 domain-containing protein [Microvirga mediterraneensis]MBA1155021.1 DUF4145 domain-containing protein [Microvirga mediterraneensis]